ncbi:TPA: hypothetical protein KD881_002614 [Vibrio parahaemolyticus]|nr:hypothetical protein [Vibrio parahaemolyticus]
MAIRRVKQRSRFTQIPNETLQDTRLSFEARGVLGLLLSKPEDWVIHKSWIQAQAPRCGKDRLTRILKELQDIGYLQKDFSRDVGGKFNGVDWLLYDTPSRRTENPPPENPDSGKSATTNTDLLTNTEVSTNTLQGKVSDAYYGNDGKYLAVWENIQTHLEGQYSGLQLHTPSDLDIDAIKWGMDVNPRLYDETICLALLGLIESKLGRAKKVLNPLQRAMVSNIPTENWEVMLDEQLDDMGVECNG